MYLEGDCHLPSETRKEDEFLAVPTGMGSSDVFLPSDVHSR